MPRLQDEEKVFELQVLDKGRIFLRRQDAGQKRVLLASLREVRKGLPTLETGPNIVVKEEQDGRRIGRSTCSPVQDIV